MSFIILFGIIHKSHYTIKLTFTFIYSIYILLVSMYILIYYFKKKMGWGGGFSPSQSVPLSMGFDIGIA